MIRKEYTRISQEYCHDISIPDNCSGEIYTPLPSSLSNLLDRFQISMIRCQP